MRHLRQLTWAWQRPTPGSERSLPEFLPEATRPKVASFARKALELDPDLVEAHVMLANVLQEEWHWTEAEAEYRRALELNPNNAKAHSGFALWLLCQGRTDEAVASIQRARALDPVGVSGGSRVVDSVSGAPVR